MQGSKSTKPCDVDLSCHQVGQEPEEEVRDTGEEDKVEVLIIVILVMIMNINNNVIITRFISIIIITIFVAIVFTKSSSSNIKRKDFCALCSVALVLPPLDSETGLTGEIWSKTKFLDWQN